MKKQLTLASSEFERFRKPTRRGKFLPEMDTVVPRAELAAAIEAYYPKGTGAGGRPPLGLDSSRSVAPRNQVYIVMQTIE